MRMASIMKASALRLLTRSELLLARTFCLAPLIESSQHLWTRRHEGLSFQFSSRAGFASAAAQDVRDDVASHMDTRASADTDRGGEDGATFTARNSSRLRPEEEARRKEKGANYVSRFKLENGGKNPSAGRLADEVGGSRNWWIKFLEQEQGVVFSAHVGPTDTSDQSGTLEEAAEEPRLPKQDDAGTDLEASMRDVSLQSMEVDAEQPRRDGIQEVKKGGGGIGNGLGKDSKKIPSLTTPALNGIEALDFPGGRNNQVLSEASEGAQVEVSEEEQEEEEEEEEKEEEEEEEEEEVEEVEEEVEEEVSRGVFIKRIPSRTTEAELLKAMQYLGPVVEVRLPKSNINSQRFTYGFAYFKTARDAQRALVVARTRPIQLQNAVVVMEPNLYATPDYRARVGLATPDQAAPSYRHNPNPKGPKHRQLQYPVYLRDIPKTVQLADLERDLGRFGKIADISYQPCVGGHVVYFETNDARLNALNQKFVWLNDRPTTYKITPYVLTIPTRIRLTRLDPTASDADLEKLFAACGPRPEFFRRSRFVCDVQYQVPVGSLKMILERIRKQSSPLTVVKLLKVFDAKIWGESSRVGGGAQLMRKIFSNKLKNLESSIDLLNVEMRDFKVMMKGLDMIFGTDADATSKNWEQGVADVEDLDAEDTSSMW